MKKGRRHIWTKKEIDYLIKNYPTKTYKEIGEKLEVSASTVSTKVKSLIKLELLQPKSNSQLTPE